MNEGEYHAITELPAPANQNPVANPDTITRRADQDIKVKVAELLANDTDPDHDPLTLTAVQASGAGGASVQHVGAWVDYEANGLNGGDTFTYTMQDGHGGTATGTDTVNLLVDSAPSRNSLDIQSKGAGKFRITFNGVPAGRTASDSRGYDDTGFSITLSDQAAHTDIHNYRNESVPGAGTPLTGTWKPDGRNVDPLVALDTTPRSTFLSSFAGLNANGRWSLFAADAHGGGASQIDSWQLNIMAVPEPETYASAVGAALVGFVFLTRRFNRSRPERTSSTDS